MSDCVNAVTTAWLSLWKYLYRKSPVELGCIQLSVVLPPRVLSIQFSSCGTAWPRLKAMLPKRRLKMQNMASNECPLTSQWKKYCTPLLTSSLGTYLSEHCHLFRQCCLPVLFQVWGFVLLK